MIHFLEANISVLLIQLKGIVLDNMLLQNKSGFISVKKFFFLFIYLTCCTSFLQGNSLFFNSTFLSAIVENDVQVSNIGDFVWEDMNGNGIQDPSELGLNGIRVVLEDTSGAQIVSIFTSTGGPQNKPGYYQFNNVVPGQYQIRFIIPLLFKFTKKDIGGNDDQDSDVDTVTGLIKPVLLEEGEQKSNLDAGLIKTATLGNFVWLDNNGNGIQESAESGINGIVVQLYNEQGILVGIKITNVNPNTGTNGWYEFAQLIPGKYYVAIIPPPAFGFIPTIPNATIESLDSDITGVNGPGTTEIINLSSGQNHKDLDGGFYQDNSIGDFIWEDINQDGIQDVTEPGINGIVVSLLDATNQKIIDQRLTKNHPTSGKAGYYLFDNLRIGTYYIQVNIPKEFVWTIPNNGSDLLDSDVDETHGPNTTGNYFVGGNNHNMTVDAGMIRGVKVGNYIWNDTGIGNTGTGQGALNGKQDVGELPQSNVKVYLKQLNSTKILETHSDTNGIYFFYVKPKSGIYFLEFDIGSQYAFTTSDYNNNIDDVFDSDVNGANGIGTTPTFSVDTLDVLKWDAGIYLKSLPLELVSFNAVQRSNVIELNWQTFNEFNTSHFEVERKYFQGDQFNFLGHIHAENGISKVSNYVYSDDHLIEDGIYYYRLKMVDQDKSYQYSDVVSAIFQNQKSEENLRVNVYPNPTSEFLNLELYSDHDDEVGYSFFNLNGSKTFEGKTTIQKSSCQKIQINLKFCNPGLYLIKVCNHSEQKIFKLQFTH